MSPWKPEDQNLPMVKMGNAKIRLVYHDEGCNCAIGLVTPNCNITLASGKEVRADDLKPGHRVKGYEDKEGVVTLIETVSGRCLGKSCPRLYITSFSGKSKGHHFSTNMHAFFPKSLMTPEKNEDKMMYISVDDGTGTYLVNGFECLCRKFECKEKVD